MSDVAAQAQRRLEKHAAEGRYVMFQHRQIPFLGRFIPIVQRWELVSPSHGSVSLTPEQLMAFGFSDYMVVDLGE
jgi:hypothetical protein